jgi:serine protease Do
VRLPALLVALTLALVAGCGAVPCGVVPWVPHLADLDPAAAFRVVAVNFDPVEAAEGSGVFLSADGLAVTCAHVVGGVEDEDDEDYITGPRWAMLAGGSVRLTVLAVDEGADLALVQVIDGGPFPFVELATDEPQPGDEVRTLTSSGVSAGRVIGAGVEETYGDVLELATEGICPGASGGAVVDRGGLVVGVILREGEGGSTLAVPAGRVRALVELVPRRWRG